MKYVTVPLAGLVATVAIFGGIACSSRDEDPPATSTSTEATSTATSTGTATQQNIPTGTSTAMPSAIPPGSTQTQAAGDLMTTEELVEYAEPAIVRIQTGSGVGSGFIVSEDGYIVTNNHVVAGRNGAPQATVDVTLSDGSVVTGTVVGTDIRSDLAIVKIDGSGYTALPLADLDDVAIGQDVVAMGYALDLTRGEGPSFSVTRGIVSQKNREITEASILGAIQTDAAINHGNSGGPLLSLYGEVVGVNTSLVPDSTSSTGVAQGIGLAVGSDTVRAVYEEIRSQGRVSRALMGIQSFEGLRPAKARDLGIPDDIGGIYLGEAASVSVGGPAGLAGIQQGDVVVSIDGVDIRNEADLAVELIRAEPGETVPVEIYRNGEKMTVDVTLGDASIQ